MTKTFVQIFYGNCFFRISDFTKIFLFPKEGYYVIAMKCYGMVELWHILKAEKKKRISCSIFGTFKSLCFEHAHTPTVIYYSYFRKICLIYINKSSWFIFKLSFKCIIIYFYILMEHNTGQPTQARVKSFL